MKKGFLNILLYFFIPLLFISIFRTLINLNNITYFVFTLVPYLLLTIYFGYKYKSIFFIDYKKINKKSFITMLIVWIIGFILMMLFNYIINYIIFNNSIAANEETNRELLHNHPLLYSIILGLLVPILEEICFRLEFKKSIKNNIIFILFTSFIFSLAHLASITKFIELIYLLPYFILGLSFSIIYYKTDCIYMNILANIIHKIVCIIIILFF